MDKEPTEDMIDYEDGDFENTPAPGSEGGILRVQDDAPEEIESAEPAEDNAGGVSAATAGSTAPGEQPPEASEVTEAADSSEAAVEKAAERSLEQMEDAASMAEYDAKALNELRKIEENDRRKTERGLADAPDDQSNIAQASTPPAQPEQPVDVRQDFLNEMHNPQKKSHKKGHAGKVFAIVILIVIVLGMSGFLGWWYIYYSRPEVALRDALEKLISSDSVNVDGVFSTETGNQIGGIPLNVVSFDAQIHGLTEFSGRVNFGGLEIESIQNAEDGSATDEDSTEDVDDSEDDLEGEAEPTDKIGTMGDYNLATDLVSLGDGTMFLKLDGLGVLDIEVAAGDEEAVDSATIIDEIDSKWYQVGAEEAAQFFGLDAETSQPAVDFYNCSMAVLGQDYSGEIKDLYTMTPFLSIEKSESESSIAGATAYDMTIDYNALAVFINALPNLGLMESFYICYNTMAEALNLNELSAESFAEIDAEDLAKMLSGYTLRFEIQNFGHELVRVSVAGTEDNEGMSFALSADLSYDYQEIATPDNYWTAEDLVVAVREYATIWLQNVREALGSNNKSEEDVDEPNKSDDTDDADDTDEEINEEDEE